MSATEILTSDRLSVLTGAIWATTAMVTLAGIDIVGTFAAKEFTLTRDAKWAFVGICSFAALWFVFVVGLKFAELTVVAFGWIVLIEVGVLLLDTMRYGVALPPGKWVAIGVIMVAQGYLVLAPS